MCVGPVPRWCENATGLAGNLLAAYVMSFGSSPNQSPPPPDGPEEGEGGGGSAIQLGRKTAYDIASGGRSKLVLPPGLTTLPSSALPRRDVAPSTNSHLEPMPPHTFRGTRIPKMRLKIRRMCSFLGKHAVHAFSGGLAM